MPKRSEYVQIPQSEDIYEEQEDEEDDVGLGSGSSLPAPTSPTASTGQRLKSPKFRTGKIDLGTLDVAFKRWTNEITKRVKRKKRLEVMSQRKDIVFSVFQHTPSTNDTSDISSKSERSGRKVKTLDDGLPMTKKDFEELTSSVKVAILDGVHPKMITKGSSGSYFARKKLDAGRSQVVGVFKPKDEEYGHLNPKTTKWIHRNLFWWVGFGRACLIPNLSYISEAAASLLDERLGLHIVPRTELVSLSSPAFSYGWIDRNAYKKGKPLPEKVGSFQTFMHSYQDASAFLREHPWPGRAISDTYDERNHRTGGTVKRCSAALGVVCGRLGEVEEEDEHEDYDEYSQNSRSRTFSWTPALQQDFREELEKLIILDYLMRKRSVPALSTLSSSQ
ncbi:phosphatidyl inositol kinase [Tulasnella sp. 419]|nr:phosphatidyl inositol kinase [Tulasnella sp. 419]